MSWPPEVTAASPIELDCKHAPKLADWIANRGGVAIWWSQDLSKAGAHCETPVLQPDGSKTCRPHWQYPAEPVVVTDRNAIMLTTYREVERVRVAHNRRGNETFASRKRRQAALARHTSPVWSWGHDDGGRTIAIIEVRDGTITLADWMANHPTS